MYLVVANHRCPSTLLHDICTTKGSSSSPRRGYEDLTFGVRIIAITDSGDSKSVAISGIHRSSSGTNPRIDSQNLTITIHSLLNRRTEALIAIACFFSFVLLAVILALMFATSGDCWQYDNKFWRSAVCSMVRSCRKLIKRTLTNSEDLLVSTPVSQDHHSGSRPAGIAQTVQFVGFVIGVSSVNNAELSLFQTTTELRAAC